MTPDLSLICIELLAGNGEDVAHILSGGSPYLPCRMIRIPEKMVKFLACDRCSLNGVMNLVLGIPNLAFCLSWKIYFM